MNAITNESNLIQFICGIAVAAGMHSPIQVLRGMKTRGMKNEDPRIAINGLRLVMRQSLASTCTGPWYWIRRVSISNGYYPWSQVAMHAV